MSDPIPTMTESATTVSSATAEVLTESAALPDTETSAETTPTTEETTPAPSGGWRSGLSGPLRDHEFLAGYDDDATGLEKLVSQHLTDQTHIRRKGVPMPNWDDTEDVKRFHMALGMPEKASDYDMTGVPIPELVSVKYDGGIQDALLGICHKWGLSQRVAEGMMQDYVALDVANEEARVGVREESHTAAQEALHSKWGRAYEGNVDLAKRALSMASPNGKISDAVLNMEMPGGGTFGSNPVVIELFSALGKKMSEGGIAGPKTPGHTAMDPASARVALDRLERENMGAILDAGHFEHKTIIDQRAALRLAIHGNEEAV